MVGFAGTPDVKNRKLVKLHFIIAFLLMITFSCSPPTQTELIERKIRKAQRSKHDKSKQYCLQILEYDSLNTFALNRIGFLDIYEDEALGYFLKSLSIDSAQPSIQYEVAYQYMLRSGVMSNSRKITDDQASNKAIQYLGNAIRLDSTFGLYYYQRSSCYLYSGRYEESERDLLKACKLEFATACEMIEKMK